MNITYATFIATVACMLSQQLGAQERPMGVCDSLNSAKDHQSIVIHAAIMSTRHETYLFEGTGQDPCPGWRKWLFTAPASIPIVVGSYFGVQVSDSLFSNYVDFIQRLKSRQKTTKSAHKMVTVSGVIIRKPWPLAFRGREGTYVGWGEGINGGSAALLVLTSIPIADP